MCLVLYFVCGHLLVRLVDFALCLFELLYGMQSTTTTKNVSICDIEE